MPNQPINIDDYRALAGESLGRLAWDYYRSGAHDELTLGRNRAAWQEIRLHYRVLVDVSKRDQRTTVLGHEVETPILVAPTAFHRMACEEGELATVRAAGNAGSIMILSTLSNTGMEDVLEASSGPVWFQLYVYKDREATRALVQRAEQAGAEALVLTVDAPLLGTRERDVRNQFRLPEGLSVQNLLPAGKEALDLVDGESGLAAYVDQLLEPGLTWELVDWLSSITKLPLLIKGVVRPDDARRAVDHGVAGIVVSNHGGRQLDTSPATAEVLGPIADAVGNELEVLVDGGIRRGTDVLKAIALGASGVLIGRPILWGLAARGQAGAEHVLQLLTEELDLAMALAGCRNIDEITRDLLGRYRSEP